MAAPTSRASRRSLVNFGV